MLILRPEDQADDFAVQLRSAGAEPIIVPAVRILPPDDWSKIDDAIERAESFHWLVFTSVNGVKAVIGRLKGRDGGAELSLRIAAIGPATRASLEDAGIKVDWMPNSYTTHALATQLPPAPPSLDIRIGGDLAGPGVPGIGEISHDPPVPVVTRVCLFRADIASSELENALAQRGFDVERVDAYRTEPINAAKISEALRSAQVVAFTSASIVRSFMGAVENKVPEAVAICAIGPATAEECRRLGLKVDAQADEHTMGGLLEAIASL